MELNLITFNLRCCDDENQNSIAERAPRVREVLSRYHVDVLCFQEISEKWQPHLEADYLKDFDMYLQYRNQTGYREGLAILWKKEKFICLKKGHFWLSDTPEVESRGWDAVYNCYRICSYAILKEKESGKSFVVMNTHYGFGNKGQIDSCELIYAYSKKISQFPTLVTGDFNMFPTSPAYGTMVQRFRDLNTCTANDLRATWHAYAPDPESPHHIDYCFIDEHISPINQVMITDLVDGKFPSDHFGLYCILDL